MSRYRLEIEEYFTVTKTTTVELDADRAEDAEALLFEQLERHDVGLDDADSLAALREAQIRVRWADEEWQCDHRGVVGTTEVEEIPDPRQGVLFS